MAYKPTLGDLQGGLTPIPTGGFQPSLSELQSGITPPSTPSYAPPLFGAIKDIGTAGLGALQGVAQLGHGLGQLETGAVNKISALLGHPTHLHAPEPNVFEGPLAHLQHTFPAQVGKFVAQAVGTLLPGAELGKLGEALGVGRRVATGLGLGTVGALTTPGTTGQRAAAGLLGGLAPEAGRGIGKVAKVVGKISRGLKASKLIDPLATDTLQDWMKGHSGRSVAKGELSSEILDAVKSNRDALNAKYSGVWDKKGNKIEKGLFDINRDKARERGYVDEPLIHPKPEKPSTIILPNSIKFPPKDLTPVLKAGAKEITPIDSLPHLKDMAKTGIYRDADLKGLVKDYLNQPSFGKAHELQSYIGKEEQNYNAGDTKFSLNQFNQLRAAKKGILNDIGTSMRNNGDSDLHDEYLNHRQGFRDEVTPYRNDATLVNTMRGKTGVNTILNNLISEKTATNKVLNDLTPKVKRQLFASHLPKGLFTKNEAGKLDISAPKLINAYDNMEDNTSRLLKGPHMEADISHLRNLVSQAKPGQKAVKVAKKAARIAAITGGVATLSYPLHHLIHGLIGE